MWMILTSLDGKGTIMPTIPDRVVYTNSSEPPGMSVLLCKDWIVSPI